MVGRLVVVLVAVLFLLFLLLVVLMVLLLVVPMVLLLVLVDRNISDNEDFELVDDDDNGDGNDAPKASPVYTRVPDRFEANAIPAGSSGDQPPGGPGAHVIPISSAPQQQSSSSPGANYFVNPIIDHFTDPPDNPSAIPM